MGRWLGLRNVPDELRDEIGADTPVDQSLKYRGPIAFRCAGSTEAMRTGKPRRNSSAWIRPLEVAERAGGGEHFERAPGIRYQLKRFGRADVDAIGRRDTELRPEIITDPRPAFTNRIAWRLPQATTGERAAVRRR